MYYKLIERSNPLQPDEQKKLYAVPQYVGRVDAKLIAKQVAAQTTLTPGDVSNVLRTFIELLPMYMLLGKTVEIEELGRMRIVFSSEGVENAKSFHTKMMRQPRVVFLCSPELRSKIATEITYEKMPVKE